MTWRWNLNVYSKNPMKTANLTGAALDWAVSQCLTGGELFQSGRVAHKTILHCVGGTTAPYFMKDSGVVRCVFEPSTNWAQGGPIIEREKLDGFWNPQTDMWSMAGWDERGKREVIQRHESMLQAAMRCFVASKLGDEVDIPEELK